jgi:hypothetical protein
LFYYGPIGAYKHRNRTWVAVVRSRFLMNSPWSIKSRDVITFLSWTCKWHCAFQPAVSLPCAHRKNRMDMCLLFALTGLLGRMHQATHALPVYTAVSISLFLLRCFPPLWPPSARRIVRAFAWASQVSLQHWRICRRRWRFSRRRQPRWRRRQLQSLARPWP